jgi:hypothetical protein
MYVSRGISFKVLYNAFRIKFNTKETFDVHYKNNDGKHVALANELDLQQAFTEYASLQMRCVEVKLIPTTSVRV